MPLFNYSAEQAFAHRRQNDFATWPQRGETNRIEPVARLRADAPFKLEPGSPIFTVGSCFARNVEGFLISAKFRVPMRELMSSPVFAGVPTEAINNYSTPSIYNEFNWALEKGGTFDPDVHCFETVDGFVDLHLGGQQKVLPLEKVRARREAVSQAYRSVVDCDAVIMTLGLSEVWFDRKIGVYINHTPLPSITRIAPGRFELHVLSHDEVSDYITRAIDIITKHSRRAPRIILTVSPVPLMSTFRDMDVAVANAYSKSVLRTVAEEMVASYDFVSYFPSFESVSLTDRKVAWMADQVHVTQDVVAVQVARMLSSYAPHVTLEGLDELEEAAVLEKANTSMSRLEATLFFQQHRARYVDNPLFRVPYVRFLLANNEALAAASLCESLDGGSTEEALLKARALRLTGRPAEALRLLEPMLSREQRSSDLWEEVVLDHATLGDAANARRVGETWSSVIAFDPSVLPRVARAIARLDRAGAMELVALALASKPDNALARRIQEEIQASAF